MPVGTVENSSGHESNLRLLFFVTKVHWPCDYSCIEVFSLILRGASVLRRLVPLLCAIATFLACCHAGSEESLLTTVGQIRKLTPDEVGQAKAVTIRGVVTFYEPAEHLLFIEDRTGSIFIRTTAPFPLRRGDLVEVRGASAGSYRAVVASQNIRVIGTGALPVPEPATFPELMSGRWDCDYVSVTGTIRSATMQQTIGQPFLLLEVLMDGGYVDVHVERAQGLNLHSLLDEKVTLTGVSGGAFDGKFQLVGAKIYLDSPADLRVFAPAAADLEALPLTQIDRVMGGYDIEELSKRVRVRGSVTLYERGTRLVIENHGKALLVHTHELTPLRLGDIVDAIGFPSGDDYSQSLDHGQFLRMADSQIIEPEPVRWQDALSGKYAFNLISIEGQLIAQVHEAQQDTLMLDADGHVFSAAMRHEPWSGAGHPPDMPKFPVGSRIRVSGVCFVESGGPWNSALWFELYMRSPDDVKILALPPWWTVQRLLYVIGGLAVLIVAGLIWGAMLRRQVNWQTLALRRTMEEEAASQRRQAFLEMQRSHVLEAINSSLPLDQVLGMITDFISEQMHGRSCWCAIAGGRVIGSVSSNQVESPVTHLRQSRREILSSTGNQLGTIILAGEDLPREESAEAGAEVLDIGASLAALAIDNRRLYEGLIHRSQYDQLTQVPNRFLLGARVDEAIRNARLHGRQLALIYIDLDRFKEVNDRFGHRVGDVYLQHVARRLSEKLRSHDTLARVGGDEFIALISVVRDRGEADEIAYRLNRCFDSPFGIEEHSIYGSASIGLSIYPEDGESEDELKRVADNAMYADKQR